MTFSIQDAEKRRGSILADRETWVPTWRDIRDYMLPYHGRFDGDLPNRGERRDRKIIQNTAGMALRVLSAGLLSGLTSPSRPWFRLGVPDPEMSEAPGVRGWLDEVERRMYTIFSQSNTYNALHRIYHELAGFGTACAIVHEDFDDVIRVRPYTIGEFGLAANSRLSVDTMERDIAMTANQMVGEFGAERVSEQVRSAVRENRGDTWINVRHLLIPNPDRQPGRRDASGKPFVSFYWEQGATKDGGANGSFLAMRGYEECPILAPRWDSISNDTYGHGPAWDALGDVRGLQIFREDAYKSLDKLLDPPVSAPSSMRTQVVDMTPGAVNFYDDVGAAQQGIKPILAINPPLGELEATIQNVVQQINQAFYVDMFLMLQQVDEGKMTATEVAERSREKLLMLGPVIEQQESELLAPLIARTFGIMLRGGLIPEPPREVQGETIQVEYISILAQAQKSVSTSSLREWVGMAGELGQLWPEALHKVNAPEVVDAYADMLGVGAKVVRTDDEVAQLVQQQQEQRQMAQMAELAEQGSAAAKNLGQTPTGGENALGAMLGTGEGEAAE